MDYRHRPAKNIERLFIVDMARRLTVAFPGDYQYIGFGAFEFIDFQLVHRALSIDRMFSIERDPIERAEFNKPFRSIKIVAADSGDAIRDGLIELDRPTILWFDYTDKLNHSILADAVEVARNVPAPSFVIFTFNGQPRMSSPMDDGGRVIADRRVEAMKQDIGEERLPSDLTDEDLSARGFARIQKRVFDSEFLGALVARHDSPSWFQVLNLQYRDGALMQTIGGFCLPAGTKGADIRRMLRGLDFFRAGDDFVDLRVPVITPRERMRLDQKLPRRVPNPPTLPGVVEDDITAYREVYRYLHFAGLQSAVETTWTD
jgi:hypothetical protein